MEKQPNDLSKISIAFREQETVHARQNKHVYNNRLKYKVHFRVQLKIQLGQ